MYYYITLCKSTTSAYTLCVGKYIRKYNNMYSYSAKTMFKGNAYVIIHTNIIYTYYYHIVDYLLHYALIIILYFFFPPRERLWDRPENIYNNMMADVHSNALLQCVYLRHILYYYTSFTIICIDITRHGPTKVSGASFAHFLYFILF